MNELMVNESNNEATMTSLELLEVINQYRIEDGKKAMRHDNFMQKIVDELEEGALKFQDSYKNNNLQNSPSYKMYKLPKDECMLMAMRESKFVRRKTVDYIKQLESKNVVTLPDFTNPALAAKAWAEQYEQREQALLEVRVKEEALLIAAPKVEFFEKVSDTTGVSSIGDYAKAINIGRNNLFKLLREMSILQLSNVPYQQYINQGYFEVKESVGNNYTNYTTYITGKGQTWVHKKLKAADYI